MLTTNLLVKHGLFNGSVGTVVDIIYLHGKRPPSSLPDVVMVDFSRYTGPPFLNEYPTVVPIEPVERLMDCSCHSCKRKQIPLRLGWGTTIHRCQGMTIGKNEPNRYIVINPGSTTFESRNPGALFVALSRAKTSGGLHQDPDFAWHPNVLINQDRICHSVATATVKAREKEITRISTLCAETLHKQQHLNTNDAFQDCIRRIDEVPHVNITQHILEE